MGDCDAIKYKGNQMTAGCCWRAGFLMTLYLKMCFFFLSLFSTATSAQVDGSGGHHPQRGPEEWRKREWLACFWEGLHGAQLLLAVNRDARQAWRLQSSRCAVCVIAPIGWTISVTFLYCFPFAHSRSAQCGSTSRVPFKQCILCCLVHSGPSAPQLLFPLLPSLSSW